MAIDFQRFVTGAIKSDILLHRLLPYLLMLILIEFALLSAHLLMLLQLQLVI